MSQLHRYPSDLSDAEWIILAPLWPIAPTGGRPRKWLLRTILDGIFPDETGAQITDTRLCFCHIDVDVYESAKDAFAFAWPRLVSGGVIVFDDYGFADCGGVTDYVDEAPWGNSGTWVYSLSGQAIVVKR